MSPRHAVAAREVAVMGIDLSFKNTAVVVLPAGWSPGDWCAVRSVRLSEEGKLAGQERVEAIVARIYERIEVYGVERVFIENYAFSFSANSITGIAEVVGALRHMVWCGRRQLVVPIVASSARKTLLGRLPKMSRKEIKKHIEIELGKMGASFEDEDTRDAFVVANRGRHDLGLACLAQG